MRGRDIQPAVIPRSVGAAAELVVAACGDRARLQRVLEGSFVPMVIIDGERRYIDANLPARLAFRLSLAQLRRLRIDDLTPPCLFTVMEAAWSRLLQTGCVAGPYEVASPDGSRLPVSYYGLADALSGLHVIAFAPAGWSDDDLVTDPDELDGSPDSALTPREREVLAAEPGYSGQDCADLLLASAMHDIGIIGIPDAVLLKPGALTAEERALIERHPEIGHEILAGSRAPIVQLAATIALTHHEQIDGHGYPSGLRGDDIPMPGRIAAVADVFDALTHERVYRPAMTSDDALAILRQRRGTHFDAAVIDALERVLPKVLEVQRRYPNAPGQLIGGRYRTGSSSLTSIQGGP